MTRQHNLQYKCTNCGCWTTAESSFGRWIRNNPNLNSSKGYYVVDQDYWIHKFKTYGKRSFQCLMLVEIKTMNSVLSPAQKDTLHLVNQVMRNRKTTPAKKMKYQAGTAPLKAKSLMSNSDVNLRVFGMHVLRFSSLGPDDSEEIWWDHTQINEAILTDIMRFDLDPDNISQELDLRSHHQTHENKVMALNFDSAVENSCEQRSMANRRG